MLKKIRPYGELNNVNNAFHKQRYELYENKNCIDNVFSFKLQACLQPGSEFPILADKAKMQMQSE